MFKSAENVFKYNSPLRPQWFLNTSTCETVLHYTTVADVSPSCQYQTD